MAVKSGADCPPIGRNRKACHECQHKEVDIRQTSPEGGLLSFSPGHHCVRSVWRWILRHTEVSEGNRKATGKERKGNVFPDRRSCSDQEGVTPTLQSRTAWGSSFPPDPSPSGELHYSHHPWVPIHLFLSFLLPTPSAPLPQVTPSWSLSKFLFFSFPASLYFLSPLLSIPVSFSTHSGEVGGWKYSWYNFSFFHF